MANEGDDRRSTWSSWLKPGDARRLDAQRPQQQQRQKLDDADERPAETTHMNAQRVRNDIQPSNSAAPILTPFIAIKHFIDDQLTAASELPSNLFYIVDKRREDQLEAERQRRTLYKRWTGSDGSFDARNLRLDQMGMEELRSVIDTTATLVCQSMNKNHGVLPELIVGLYNDPEGYHQYEPRRDASATILEDLYKKPFLSIPWFKYDPYSPITLEANPLTSKYDTKWRHAFEDLLEASLGKPMSSQEMYGMRPFGFVHSTWRGPGLDWMLSLQCRGMLPPQVPSWYLHVSENNEPVTLSHLVGQQGRSITLGSRNSAGMSGDYLDLVREVSTAAAEDSQQRTTELDMYEQLENQLHASKDVWSPGEESLADLQLRAMKRRLLEAKQDDALEPLEALSRPSRGRCPDELGRAVGAAAQPRGTLQGEHEVNGDMFGMSLASAWHDESKLGEAYILERLEALERELEDVADLDKSQLQPGEAYTLERLAALRRGLGDVAEASDLDKSKFQPGEPYVLEMLAALKRGLEDVAEVSELDKRHLSEEISSLRECITDLWNHNCGFERYLQELKSEKATRGSSYVSRDSSQQCDVSGASDASSMAVQGDVAEARRPSVLSTMTKTETTRMPDGSVKTTVVLKRRFADGREETQESTQTTFDGSANEGGEQTEDKKGWFWY